MRTLALAKPSTGAAAWDRATLNHMVDAFVRDYLIERIEMALDHRALTGYYPRLTLAPGQRFASKGGYIVRFTDAQGTRITPLGEWITP